MELFGIGVPVLDIQLILDVEYPLPVKHVYGHCQEVDQR